MDSKLSKKNQNLESEDINGIGNTQLNEDIPNYNAAICEKVIDGKNNTWIVLGRDRPSDIFSGYGGKGFKKAGSIDLVSGRTSAIIKTSEEDQKVFTDPSIAYDAARIIILQKTDVDDNFYLPGEKIAGKSAVAIKADNIRVIAREGIKFVTNVDKYDSNGQLKIKKYGVSFIANDGQDIQPIPKGYNLEEVIRDIYEKISQQQIAGIFKILSQLIGALIAHTHPASPALAGPSPDLSIILSGVSSDLAQMLIECQTQQVNAEFSKLKYLSPGSEKYINSLFHKLD